MKRHSFVMGAAALCAFAAVSFAQSNNSPAASPQSLGAADPSSTTHFSVYLPLTHQAALEQLVNDQTTPSSPSYHKWLTPAQFKSQFGPRPSDVAHVSARLEAAGFTITAVHTQSIEVTGSVADVETLFSTRLNQMRMPQGQIKFSAANHKLSMPAELATAGAVIPTFFPELAAHVHSVALAAASSVTAGKLAATQNASPNQRLSTAANLYLPDDLNEAYSLPSFQTEAGPFFSHKQIAGVGSHIGIVINSVIDPDNINDSFNISLSAGPSLVDIQDYSAVSNLPLPSVTIRPVDGGSGPFNPNSSSAIEASLDTQISLGTAPGAQETIYNIADLTFGSIADGYAAIDDDNTVDIVSSSFGGCELYYTPAYNNGVDLTVLPRTLHQLFLQGNAQGITFLASTGDNGAVPCETAAFRNNPTNGTSFVEGAENPASDPNVTAVGGTNLVTVPTPTVNDATYSQENAQFDPLLPAKFLVDGSIVTVGNNTWGSGGGYSVIFAKPLYQLFTNTSKPGRAVPDVALMMGGCPNGSDFAAGACSEPVSSDIVWVGNALAFVIGTSSASPEMAGVLALDVELNGRLGNVNPLIYNMSFLQTVLGPLTPPALQPFHRNITGNNNGFTVKRGQAYSTVLGNSTLNVKNFLGLQGAASAGTPGTATNPKPRFNLCAKTAGIMPAVRVS